MVFTHKRSKTVIFTAYVVCKDGNLYEITYFAFSIKLFLEIFFLNHNRGLSVEESLGLNEILILKPHAPFNDEI